MKMINGFDFYRQQMAGNVPAKGPRPENGIPGKGRPEEAAKGGIPGMAPVDTFERSEEAAAVGRENQVELSEAAQNLLDELKEKYSNMDFFVANYSTDEEAQQYLSRGTKEYSVLIDPETLEKMAQDMETKQYYTDILDGAGAKFDEIKEELGEDADKVERLSLSIDSEGTVKYFASLAQISDKQRERIEEAREARNKENTEKADKDDKPDKPDKPEMPGLHIGRRPTEIKLVQVSANSTEELVELIKNFDWDSVEPVQLQPVGGRVDFRA